MNGMYCTMCTVTCVCIGLLIYVIVALSVLSAWDDRHAGCCIAGSSIALGLFVSACADVAHVHHVVHGLRLLCFACANEKACHRWNMVLAYRE